jgi:hypothetical protein
MQRKEALRLAAPDARERIPNTPFGHQRLHSRPPGRAGAHPYRAVWPSTLSFTRALPTEWRGLSALEVLNLLKDSIDNRPHHDLTLVSRCQRRVTEYP